MTDLTSRQLQVDWLCRACGVFASQRACASFLGGLLALVPSGKLCAICDENESHALNIPRWR